MWPWSEKRSDLREVPVGGQEEPGVARPGWGHLPGAEHPGFDDSQNLDTCFVIHTM